MQIGLIYFYLEKSFLQGFECLSWDYSKDKNIAIEQDSDIINEIKTLCKNYKVAISSGYIEKNKR